MWAVVQGSDVDDDDETVVITANWVPQIQLVPGAEVENVFRHMSRTPGRNSPCLSTPPEPLLQDTLPKEDKWACVRLVNEGSETGIWRIDFEGAFGAGYHFELVSGDRPETVLAYPKSENWWSGTNDVEGRRIASRPLVIEAGRSVELFVQIKNPSDLADADPMLRPERDFDEKRLNEAHGFGALIGAAGILLLVVFALSKLVSSEPASRFTTYFAAAMLSAISSAGYFNGLVPGNPLLPIGMLNKILEAAQVAGHLVFMAAFVREGVANSRLPDWLTRIAYAAVGLLALAGLGSLIIGGPAVALRYFDLGFELDPLIEDPLRSIPSFLGALVTATWIAAIAVTSIYLLRNRAAGGTLFAIGSGILAFGLLAAGLGDEAFEIFDDTTFGLHYVLLADALIFTAALARQAFGLRDQRDAAIRQELQATYEKMEMAETLLEARRDSDRSKALAEKHRTRLALTGHDLRQPLTSLHLALTEAEKTNPALGDTLRTSLDYIRSVLNETVTHTRPEDVAEDEGSYHTQPKDFEAIEVDILLSNAVRMFAQEARSKGLSLHHEATDLTVRTVPVTVIRILSNLVSNAVKYTPEGGVTLRAVQNGETISIEVHDTGRGMSDDEIQQIQESYVRGSEAHAADGDGLGLSSARDFAASLGLKLRINSQPGEGSCFAIDGLPRVSPSEILEQ